MDYTDRCGVCKDIAGTLVSFLRMAGFKAYPAMTMAGSRVEKIPADHFNHCVAVVELSNGTLMPLDPTWVPFCRELWSSAEQQQNYLPGVPQGVDLCVTPVSPAENHYVRINADNKLKADGTLVGKFTISAEGQSDSKIRRIFTTGFQSEWQNAMEKQLLNVSPKAVMKSVNYGSSPKDYQKAPISITFTYEIPEYAMIGDGEMIFKPFVLNNLYTQVLSFLNINTDIEVRKYGFRDACSRLVEVAEKLSLPTGYNMVCTEKQTSVDGKAAAFSGTLKQNGNKLMVDTRLSLNKRIYTAADWKEYRESVNAYKSYGEYIVIRK